MRRDDRELDPSEGVREIDAIAAQWTRTWEATGGPAANQEDITRREEYRALDRVVRSLPNGARMFDGGCGMGAWTVHFSRRGFPTLGFDISKPTIESLRKLYPDQQFMVGDIRATGEPASSFDVYFSWGTFEHFEEGFGPVIDEAFRILKPGGLLVVSIPFDNLRHSWRATFAKASNVRSTMGRQRFYQWRLTRGELADALARSGFLVQDVKIIHKPQGTLRWLQHSLGANPDHRLSRAVAYGLSLVVPATLVGHMILAVASKPADLPSTDRATAAAASLGHSK